MPQIRLSPLASALLGCWLSHFAMAANASAVTLDAVEVDGKPAKPVQPALPEVKKAKIYLGKKTTLVDMRQQPTINNASPRQLFAQVPGIFISDQFSQGQWNIGWRGLGDPHESEFTTIMMNDIPIMSDWMTYNTLLWAPPIQRVANVEVTFGGAGLLSGPQPGPHINLVMRSPQLNTDVAVRSDFTLGGFGFRGNYNEIGAGGERFAYLLSSDYRQSDGERVRSGYRVQSAMGTVLFQESEAARWLLDLNAYQSFNQEAGRLSLAQWQSNPDLSIRPFDDFRIQRLQASLTHERRLSEYTLINAKGWLGYHDRFSRRAGTVLPGQPTPSFTTFDRQQFQFAGFDARMAHNWGSAHTMTGGVVLYRSDSPRSQGRATDVRAPAQTTLRFLQERDSSYTALFFENAFRFGNFSIVPSLRTERLTLGVNETTRLASLRRPAIQRDFSRSETLLGLGLSQRLSDSLEAYGNISQGYRPMRFDDVANPSAETLASNDPGLSASLSTELGLRGTPLVGLVLDASLFRINFDDKIEQRLVGVSDLIRINSGDARHQGLDLSTSYDLLANQSRKDSLKLFASNTWLNAQITRSADPALLGKRPQFAPKYQARAGLIYAGENGAKAMLSGSFSASQFWQDSNLARGTGAAFLPAKMPSFQVFDLSGEYPLGERFLLSAGVDNLSDKRYFSRIRTDGIEPAPGRFAYVGLRINL